MERWRRWWTTYRRRVLILLVQITVVALIFAPLGATKYQDNTGDSYLHSVVMSFLGAMAICLIFAVVAVAWAFRQNRAPLDRAFKRDPE